MNHDQEVTFRVGNYRVHFYPVEGGMSVESFSVRHNGHPQGDWLVAHEDEFEHPDCAEAILRAEAYKASNQGRAFYGHLTPAQEIREYKDGVRVK